MRADSEPYETGLFISDNRFRAPALSAIAGKKQPQCTIEALAYLRGEEAMAEPVVEEPPPEAIPPDQQLKAPIVVEARGGRVAPVEMQGRLASDERDFTEWRDTTLAHVRSAINLFGDTNHYALRERLDDVSSNLSVSVSEMRSKQFQLGYAHMRFRALLAAYKSDYDDLPSLLPDRLADLDALDQHLGIGLSKLDLGIGLSKLDRRRDFTAIVQERANELDTEKAQAVADAMDEMENHAGREAQLSDPELPRSLRVLADALRDPFGASKAVLFGAVRSIENVLSFVARVALGFVKNVGEGFSDGGKKVGQQLAKSFILIAGGAGLVASGAVGAAWPWLSALLDFLSKAAPL